MPFFDATVKVTFTSSRNVEVTVDAPDRETAAELAAQQAAHVAQMDGPDPGCWESPIGETLSMVLTDFVEKSPEARFLERSSPSPLRGRGMHCGGLVALDRRC